jgi:anti-sigma regulatory factor (Ser/Thr protein kinase)
VTQQRDGPLDANSQTRGQTPRPAAAPRSDAAAQAQRRKRRTSVERDLGEREGAQGYELRRLSLAPDLNATADARRALEGLSGRLDQDVLRRSALVVTEVVSNSVKHAGLTATQRIKLTITVLPERLRIEVTDEGGGFHPVVNPPDPLRVDGRGLWIVDQLTDRWGVDLSHSTRVWCEFDLSMGSSQAGARRHTASVEDGELARAMVDGALRAGISNEMVRPTPQPRWCRSRRSSKRSSPAPRPSFDPLAMRELSRVPGSRFWLLRRSRSSSSRERARRRRDRPQMPAVTTVRSV